MINLGKRFRCTLLVGAIILALISLSACGLSKPELTPVPLFTATPTFTVTPTILWFPPTPTMTPQPTLSVQPTQVLMPGIGSLLFEDTFQTGQNWQKSSSPNGNIVPGGGELTLAVLASKASLITIRQDTQVSDFYGEVTVNASLCRGDDMFGMVFRSVSDQTNYRYLVDCNGRVSAQVVIGATPTFMQDWVASGDLQPGLPYSFTMSVWASKNVMRFFLNGNLQFEITRDLFRSGGIGFFARSASDSPLSVNFSDLKVYSVSSNAPVTSLTPAISSTPTPSK